MDREFICHPAETDHRNVAVDASLIVSDRNLRREPPSLLCVPYAGGNEDCFNAIRVRLRREATVSTICYPGRGRRSSETRPNSLKAMIAEVDAELDRIDGPTVLLGYSMGAIVAYEVALKRQREMKHCLSHLVVLACRAPLDFRVQSLLEFEDDMDFANVMAKQGALPMNLLSNPYLLHKCLPTLRSDLEACRYYKPSSSAVSCPLTVIGGDCDPLASTDEITRWLSYTTGKAECFVVRGEHFFLKKNLNEVTKIIRENLNQSAGHVYS